MVVKPPVWRLISLCTGNAAFTYHFIWPDVSIDRIRGIPMVPFIFFTNLASFLYFKTTGSLTLSFLLLVRPPWHHSILIIGWCGSNPIKSDMGSLYSVTFYLGLCATFPHLTDGSGTPLSPPSEIPQYRAPCTPMQFSRVCISLSSSCPLSVRLSFIFRPPQ